MRRTRKWRGREEERKTQRSRDRGRGTKRRRDRGRRRERGGGGRGRGREAAVRKLGQGNNKKEHISAQTMCKIINKYAHTNAYLMDLRIVAICILSFTAFLRYDELSNIKYCDILFGSNYLKIFRNLQNRCT